MAIFAQPTQDENLVPGWNVQGNINPGGETGYAQAAAVPASPANGVSTGQAGAGLPNPPQAFDINNENSAAYGESILTNPGYADGNTSLASSVIAPIPSTATAVQNPFGMNATVALTVTGVTSVQVAPFTTGSPAFGPAIAFAAAGIFQVSVPPAGFLKAAGTAISAATWTPTN